MKPDARETAFSVLYACRKNGAWSDVDLKKAIDRNSLDKRDAALASRICYGVIQNRSLLDFYIGNFCARPMSRLEPAVPDILRMGTYQILFMDRVPDTAAVNESVNMAKRKASRGAAGLVNGVLRAISAHKDDLPEIPKDDMAEYYAVKYSHPVWFVRRCMEMLGDEAEEFFRANNVPAPITARVNAAKTDVSAILEELEREGVEAKEHPWLPGSIVIEGGDVRTVTAFEKGEMFVQDVAATLSVLAADAKEGWSVLDACSAPGGKSFAIASLLRGKCRITARDVNERKVKVIAEGAKRLGFDEIITAEQGDGRIARESDREKYDCVIVDAPCSGMGIIRKKPDVRTKTAEEIAGLPAIQYDILAAASKAVKKGGMLIYSTCTVMPEENSGVVRRFLGENPDFETESFTLPGAIGTVPEGLVTLWPQRHDTDGFFVCRMKRKN